MCSRSDWPWNLDCRFKLMLGANEAFEKTFIIELSRYNNLILYRKYKLLKWVNKGKRLCLIGGFALVLIGCSSFPNLQEVEGYDSQKRIVWQGTLTVQLGEDLFRMIYFGYDRNGGMHRLTEESICRGVDLLEYKGLLPNGHWVFHPIMILTDDNFDCYADRVLYDCDADGNFEKVADIPEGTVRLEFIDDAHRKLIESNCLKSWSAH